MFFLVIKINSNNNNYDKVPKVWESWGLEKLKKNRPFSSYITGMPCYRSEACTGCMKCICMKSVNSENMSGTFIVLWPIRFKNWQIQ